MKKKRLDAILRIISQRVVTTQEELLDLLKAEGFEVTQATVSRDIKELRLIKASDLNGNSRYTSISNQSNTSPKNDYIFASSVISIVYAMNDVVIKCYPGMANAACAAIDSLNLIQVVGTLAGDDTIFIVTRSEDDARDLTELLNSMK